MYRQAGSDRSDMAMCALGKDRRPAAGVVNQAQTRFRNNTVVCSVCDDDGRNVTKLNHPVAELSKTTQQHTKADARRLAGGVQRGKNPVGMPVSGSGSESSKSLSAGCMKVPKTCDKQTVDNTYWRRHDSRSWANKVSLPASLPVHTDNWFTKEQALVFNESKRIQQMKDRETYYRERNKKLHGTNIYKNDLKQAERDERDSKQKASQCKYKYGTKIPEVSYRKTPLSKEELYEEELRRVRIAYNHQRKKCAVNNPLNPLERIPPIPSDPPTGSVNVKILSQCYVGPDLPRKPRSQAQSTHGTVKSSPECQSTGSNSPGKCYTGQERASRGLSRGWSRDESPASRASRMSRWPKPAHVISNYIPSRKQSSKTFRYSEPLVEVPRKTTQLASTVDKIMYTTASKPSSRPPTRHQSLPDSQTRLKPNRFLEVSKMTSLVTKLPASKPSSRAATRHQSLAGPDSQTRLKPNRFHEVSKMTSLLTKLPSWNTTK